jgi:hypothetical protein
MHWLPAQVARLDHRSHATRYGAELVVVANRHFDPVVVGQFDQTQGLLRIYRKRLLDIDVATLLMQNFASSK